MSWQMRTGRLRLIVVLILALVAIGAVGGVLAWQANQHNERFRDQGRRVAELQKQKARVTTTPAEVAEIWRRWPGTDPEIFQQVTEIVYSPDMVVSDYTLRSLEGMTDLQSLKMPNATVTDASVAFLQQLHKLETLEVSSGKLTDAGIEQLSQLQTLKHLTLHGEIGNKSVKAIASLRNLESLDLQGRLIDDRALGDLAQLPALKKLSLAGKFSDDGLEKLAGCKQLVNLELFALGATDRTLRALRTLPHLESLSIAEGAYTDDAVLALKTWPQLKHFSCQGASIAATPKKWDLLLAAPFKVSPDYDTPDPEKFYELGGFVEEINMVVGTEWTGEDWDIAHGGAFKDVTDVNIVSPRVHDRGVARLVRLGSKLQSLTISDAAITPAVADYLARMRMQWLSIKSAQIDDSWVPALSQLTNVSRLELVNTKVSAEGLEKLKEAGVKVVTRSKTQTAQQDSE